ncbi:ankyrin [Xylaria arbuscula]|nr:ankyrin [Xylaria arbuscula]
MDPLSGVASAFAVISLALQLAQSALSIKRFLDTIQNVPTEIIRLKSLFHQLYLVIQTITSLLQLQQGLQSRDAHVSSTIYDSLKTCQEKVDLIRNIFQIGQQAKKEENLISRNWAQFKLACNKKKIVEFERHLEQSISLLSVNLLVNLLQSNILIESDIRCLTQLSPSNTQVLPLKGVQAYQPRSRELRFSLDSYKNRVAAKSQPSIFKKWSRGKSLNIQYHELHGRNGRQSLLLRVNIYNLYAFALQLSRFFGTEPSAPFGTISARNLVPENAAIFNACTVGDGERVRQLLKSRAARPNDVTPSNKTPLGVAINGGFEEIVQLLLLEGADPNIPCGSFQMSPLQYGVVLNKQNIVRILVQRGADPTYTSAAGWSLLHYMFDKGRSVVNTRYFSVFRDCLIFDDVQDSQGWTSLHRCAAFGTEEDIHSLHQVGAPAYSGRYTTVWGGSPMHVAAMNNNVSTLEGLFNLANGQLDTLDAVDNQGWTPLHTAVYHGAKDAMRWLLNKGADPHRTTYRCGWFPYGHEGEVFNVADLAVLSGATCQEALVGILKDIGHDIAVEGDDIYWESR